MIIEPGGGEPPPAAGLTPRRTLPVLVGDVALVRRPVLADGDTVEVAG
jgi:hypothetical protein